MKEFLWRRVARFAARPKVAQWLFRRAEKTPYFNLDGYMNRWWLFNQITEQPDGTKRAKYPWLPFSVRMHHILRADEARDPHNHPGSFRTLILKGAYIEHREARHYVRVAGDTSTLMHGEFHHVSSVSPGGVWTVFIMWDWKDTWGFRKPDGTVINWKSYKNGGQP